MRSEIAETLASNSVRYSQVWEDHSLLAEGLDVGPDDDVLSITSAGDNVLALLLEGARSVTAIDLNPAQGYLLELKLAGIRELRHDEFVILLGVRPPQHASRVDLYTRVRHQLSDAAREFWDARRDAIADGLVHAGKLESYFRGFSDMNPLGCDSLLLSEFLSLDNLDEQRDAFLRDIATPEFESAFRSYFGRDSMEAQGRDPAQFRYVEEGDVGLFFWKRFRWVCTHLPMRTNFYLHAFLTGGIPDLEEGPAYLRPSNYDKLRASIDRVSIVTDEIESFVTAQPIGSFSKLNLSDMFEYMSEDAADRLFDAIGRWVRPGGRMAYWNLLVPRTSPSHVRDRLRPLEDLSKELWNRDRSWFYRSFHIEEVTA